MPGNGWDAEAKPGRHQTLNRETAFADRGKGAGRAGEFYEFGPLPGLGKSLEMTAQLGHIHGKLVAERDRECVLAVGASGHHGVSMRSGEIFETLDHVLQVAFD